MFRRIVALWSDVSENRIETAMRQEQEWNALMCMHECLNCEFGECDTCGAQLPLVLLSINNSDPVSFDRWCSVCNCAYWCGFDVEDHGEV